MPPSSPAVSVCFSSASRNASWSSSAYGFAATKPATSSPSASARLRTRACTTGEANAAATSVTSTIPAWYLVAIATPSATPASAYSRVRPVR